MSSNGRAGRVTLSSGERRGRNLGLGIRSLVGDAPLAVGPSGGDLLGGDDGVIAGFGVQEDGCGEMEITGVVAPVDDGCMALIKAKLAPSTPGCCCCCEAGCVACVSGPWLPRPPRDMPSVAIRNRHRLKMACRRKKESGLTCGGSGCG